MRIPALAYRIGGRALRLWWKVARVRTLGVRVIATDPAGRIALVRHRYVAGWYLPGGGVARGEHARDAALRELREETALEAGGRVDLSGVHLNRAEGKDDHVIVFHVPIAHPAALCANDPHEIAEAGWFAPDALPPDTSAATRRRIADHLAGRTGLGEW